MQTAKPLRVLPLIANASVRLPPETPHMEQQYNILGALDEDVKRALREFYDNDDPYTRRAFVRVFATAVEGETYRLKRYCLTLLDDRPTLYSHAEIALLRDEAYHLRDDASATTRPRFLRMADNFHFALKAFAKDTIPNLDIRKDTKGWTTFTRAIAVRNRVTHPKTDEDVEILDADIACVQHAYLWYRKTLMRTMVQANLALHDKAERLEARLRGLGAEPLSIDPLIIPRDELSAQLDRLDALDST